MAVSHLHLLVLASENILHVWEEMLYGQFALLNGSFKL